MKGRGKPKDLRKGSVENVRTSHEWKRKTSSAIMNVMVIESLLDIQDGGSIILLICW